MEDKIREAVMKMGKPEDQPAMAIEICNDAFRDLMVEKMMTALERTSGANMDKTAAITVAYLNEVWGAAMTGKELPRTKTDEYIKKFAASMQG
jgi:tRNA U55 pseudouridine synthase TruB